MDLGADGITTFRYVTFPAMRTALVAGALLAFGLSFDEIVVTIYLSGTTLDAAAVDLQQHHAAVQPAGGVRGRGRRAC